MSRENLKVSGFTSPNSVIGDLVHDELHFTLHLLNQQSGLETGIRLVTDESGTFYESDLPTAKEEVEYIFNEDTLSRLHKRLTVTKEEDKNL